LSGRSQIVPPDARLGTRGAQKPARSAARAGANRGPYFRASFRRSIDYREGSLKKIVGEIHRRSVWQCLGIYLAASWLALQVVDILADNVGLPDWVFPFAIVLLVIGLPVVLATAVVQERLPGASPRPARRHDRAPEPGDYATSGRRSSAADATRSPEPAPPADAHRRWLTWKNALSGGALAFLLLFVVTAGFMYMRSNGIGPAGTLVARGVIDERSPILVADFEASDGDAELARAMTEAFKIDFSQTKVVRLLEPARIADALRRMELDPSTPMSIDVARRVARREGIPAIIGGSLTHVPGGFVLAGRIEDPDGAVLVSHRETASDSTDVLPAIDALSAKLRERLGDSFVSLRADEPLAQATTPSLRALELYTQALRTIEYNGDSEGGVRLLEEALEEDPEFAMAWRKLGVELNNSRGARSRIVEALTRAYELRERLTPRERYLAEAAYHSSVTLDRQRAIDAYERMLDLDPNDSWALNNMAVLYGQEGDAVKELELTSRAAALDTSSTTYGNLVIQHLQLGDVEAADSALAAYRQLFAADRRFGTIAALVEVHHEDYAGAEEVVRAAIRTTGGVANHFALSAVLRSTGRLDEADAESERAAEAAAAAGVPGSEFGLLWTRFFTDVYVRGDKQAARRKIDRTLAEVPLDELDPLDRPYLTLSGMYAVLGDRARAEEMMAAFHEAVPDAPEARYEDDEALMTATLAASEARWDDALSGYEEFRRLEPGCEYCFEYETAQAYDSAGRPDSALAWYGEAIDTHGAERLWGRSYEYGPALERMAQILDEQGRLDEAAAYYSRFADLWADADPELQPRVTAARARAEEIVRARG
jgi:tetratricopeptide (TPR) repeat protein